MRIKELRKQMGKKQSDISKMLNIATSTYSGYELGTSEPSLEILFKLANFYNVSLDYLCDRAYSPIGFVPENRVLAIKQLATIDEMNFLRVQSYMQGIIDSNSNVI